MGYLESFLMESILKLETPKFISISVSVFNLRRKKTKLLLMFFSIHIPSSSSVILIFNVKSVMLNVHAWAHI